MIVVIAAMTVIVIIAAGVIFLSTIHGIYGRRGWDQKLAREAQKYHSV